MKSKGIVWGFFILIFLIAGCSGGTNPGPFTITLDSQAALDGDVTAGGAVTTTHEWITIGDSNTKVGRRGFVSFDLSTVRPTDSKKTLQIDSAILKMSQVNWNLFPYDLGPVLVEQVDYGVSLDAGDYHTASLTVTPLILCTDTDYQKHEVNVTQAVQDTVDVSSSSSRWYRPQFRLRHQSSSDNDNSMDVSNWGSGNYDYDDDYPKLILTYRVVNK